MMDRFKVFIRDNSMAPLYRDGDELEFETIEIDQLKPGRTYLIEMNSGDEIIRILDRIEDDGCMFFRTPDPDAEQYPFWGYDGDFKRVGVCVAVKERPRKNPKPTAAKKKGRNRPDGSGELGGNPVYRSLVPALAC